MDNILSSPAFWTGIVVVTVIVAITITGALYGANETKRKLAEAAQGGDYKRLAEESAAVQRQLLTRLDGIESRLATVEKTLTDIPG
ncbi:hypothetical protein [Pseudolysinimonas sp.]|jgi:hypothetical protein|uniref:hypothetical protein n=1 Tax=Pseudolysinimonas sp. TaxID=2680009 RepID=UPI0037835385